MTMTKMMRSIWPIPSQHRQTNRQIPRMNWKSQNTWMALAVNEYSPNCFRHPRLHSVRSKCCVPPHSTSSSFPSSAAHFMATSSTTFTRCPGQRILDLSQYLFIIRHLARPSLRMTFSWPWLSAWARLQMQLPGLDGDCWRTKPAFKWSIGGMLCLKTFCPDFPLHGHFIGHGSVADNAAHFAGWPLRLFALGETN